ncbi:MAG TPA: hypothetical protein VMH84_09920 [Xanthobacteraceae bacterium]|nr:hypothetical protein [Xanthobacteraceae bacterium]
MRLVVKALAGAVAFVIVAFGVMMISSRGHNGLLIRSTPGRFEADTNIYSDLLARNYTLRGFRKCEYFTGFGTFTNLEGPRCPWYTTEDPKISNIRERAD